MIKTYKKEINSLKSEIEDLEKSLADKKKDLDLKEKLYIRESFKNEFKAFLIQKILNTPEFINTLKEIDAIANEAIKEIIDEKNSKINKTVLNEILKNKINETYRKAELSENSLIESYEEN